MPKNNKSGFTINNGYFVIYCNHFYRTYALSVKLSFDKDYLPFLIFLATSVIFGA